MADLALRFGGASFTVCLLATAFAGCVGGEVAPVSEDSGGDAADATSSTDGADATTTLEAGGEDATGDVGSIADAAGDASDGAAAACGPGYATCNGAEVACTTNIADDPLNCGACNNACGTKNTTKVSCGAPAGGADAGGSGGCVFTCSSAAYAHCGQSDATGCETNIGTDPANCGACGHSCGGGQCVGGFCQPVVLAGDPTNPYGLKSLYGIVVLNGYVYGVDWEGAGAFATPSHPGGLVYKVSTTPGGTLSWIVGQGVGASADSIATDGTSITYSIFHVGEGQGAGIWKVNPDGTNNKLVVSGGTTGGGPACGSATAYGYETSAVAFDSGYIYWIRDTYGGCFPSPPSCQCQGIYRANADGSGVTQYFTSVNGTAKWYTLPIADSGTLYMLDYFGGTVVAATSATFTANSAPIALPTAGTPVQIQTDTDFVYWIDTSAKKFYRAAKVGATSAQDITPAAGMPAGSLWSSFLVDAHSIYFVSPAPTYNVGNAEKIYVMPKDGSGPARAIPGANISSAGDSVTSWTQDASALYWTTYGFDSAPPPYSVVSKLAK